MRYFYALLAMTLLAAGAPSVRAANITPAITGFKQTGLRSFELATAWYIREPAPAGYDVFVHITGKTKGPNGDIVMVIGNGLANPPSSWKVDATVLSKVVNVALPATVPDGTYEIKVGMYIASTGNRLEMIGSDDGTHRYSIGKFIVQDHGQSITMPGAPTVTADMDGRTDIRPSVVGFHQGDGRSFSFKLSWIVNSVVPHNEKVFVHLTLLKPDATHDLITSAEPVDDIAPDAWPVDRVHVSTPVNVSLPSDLADGTYSIRVGLYSTADKGSRLTLALTDDGTGRYILGTVVVSEGGTKIEWHPLHLDLL